MYMRRRSKKKHYRLTRLSEFLPKVLKKENLSISTLDPTIAAAWKTAVGPLISNQTAPVRFTDGTLHVKVATSAWMQQLQFMKNEIIEKVNERLAQKKISSLYFSIGRLTAKELHGKEEMELPQFDPNILRERDKRIVAESIRSIPDEELKSIVERVMIKGIINRRFRS